MHEYFVFPRHYNPDNYDDYDVRELREWFNQVVGTEDVDWGISSITEKWEWFYYWFRDPKCLTLYFLKWGTHQYHRPHFRADSQFRKVGYCE
jgi:hypothetical protein